MTCASYERFADWRRAAAIMPSSIAERQPLLHENQTLYRSRIAGADAIQ